MNVSRNATFYDSSDHPCLLCLYRIYTHIILVSLQDELELSDMLPVTEVLSITQNVTEISLVFQCY